MSRLCVCKVCVCTFQPEVNGIPGICRHCRREFHRRWRRPQQ